jgi:3'-phosphoadenosine 5'-phosphosulfate sulfotransferase (PAPS reductase)/FAD synthetase
VKVKPRVTWEELYNKYGFPLAHARWCNSEYKLDCKKQLNEWILSQNCRPLAYIGFCADETKRFKYELGDWKNQDVCYPLAEEGIEEYQILEWAKNQPIFENYYKYFSRQGCRICPFMTMKEMAYLYITDKESFDYMFKCIKETENKIFLKNGKKYLFRGEGADIIKERVISKWVNQINYEKNQYTIYDFLK